jgi:putative peptide zinc metalloprotease protein
LNPKIKDEVRFFGMDGGIVHVYDPTSGKHFRMGEQEVGWLQMLDGRRSKEELRGAIPEEYFDRFFAQAAQLGLLDGERSKKRVDPFKIKLPTVSPNGLLGRWQTGCYVYRQILNATFPLLLLANLFVLPYVWKTLQAPAATFHFTAWTVPVYILAILICGFVHEMSHAAVAKSYGAHVPSIGIMLFYLHPAFFADVSGISLLKSHRARINVLLAGIMANNLLITAAFGIYSLVYKHASSVYLLYFVALNAVLMLVNLTPFIEYDGYYILLELFGEPNYRLNAMRSLTTAGARRFDYIAYFVLSNIFALATIFVALITARRLALRVSPAVWVNYGCLALMILSYAAFAMRTARRRA